jgi:hypothetical protein
MYVVRRPYERKTFAVAKDPNNRAVGAHEIRARDAFPQQEDGRKHRLIARRQTI